MANPIVALKDRLSRVNPKSWHYKMVDDVWGTKAAGKACTYYWFKLPLAALAFALFVIITFVGSIGGLIFGYLPTMVPAPKNPVTGFQEVPYGTGTFFYPYKTLPNGRKMPLAVWEVILLAGVGFVLYYLGFMDQELGLTILIWVLSIAIGAAVVFGVIFAVSASWKNPLIARARSNLVATWNKVCPELVIEKNTEQITSES